VQGGDFWTARAAAPPSVIRYYENNNVQVFRYSHADKEKAGWTQRVFVVAQAALPALRHGRTDRCMYV
jgi:hypothetical protein